MLFARLWMTAGSGAQVVGNEKLAKLIKQRRGGKAGKTQGWAAG
jgi:hypothetical protein